MGHSSSLGSRIVQKCLDKISLLLLTEIDLRKRKKRQRVPAEALAGGEAGKVNSSYLFHFAFCFPSKRLGEGPLALLELSRETSLQLVRSEYRQI